MAITIYELERRLTSVEQSFQCIQEQLDKLEKLFENFRGHANSCFEALFQRLDQHDQSFSEVFRRLDEHDHRFDIVDTRLVNIEQNMITHADLVAMESRLKDFILATFQNSPQ